MLQKYKKFIRYNCAAIISTLSDWVAFLILYQFGAFFLYSQMTARLVGGITSFYINKNWSFGSPGKANTLLHGRRFIMLFIFSYFLSNYMLYVSVKWLGISLYWAKLAADGFCYIVNYFVMKSYVYIADRSLLRFLQNHAISRHKTR